MINADTHSFTNHLIHEKSPYLLQHAHNPVDWYPWGEEAFEKARKEDKPIFLSIGYATCHWCHVMEHESFENEEVAALMNEHFVCIKVDREERPDIDNIYMTVCQMMTGQGGWPLNIFMTPNKKPFHAATYISPDQRYGRIGMKQLIPRVSEAWENQREQVLQSADHITRLVAKQNATDGSGATLDSELLKKGYTELLSQYDPQNGGFGMKPKFPTPHRLTFLMRYGESEGMKAVEHTLREMRKGGIFDQIGFGFHRYSTDNHWLLPHFEKMLYDQALLAIAYTEAFEKTGNPFYRQVTDEILAYVQRDMTTAEGAFYSAEDADSEGEEGVFYIWNDGEIKTVLGDESDFVLKIWNVEPEGNFHDESTGRKNGKNIPHLSDFPGKGDAARLEIARLKLFDVREKREHPFKDTKVLADWNGLMITAFAKAGRAFGEEKYLDAAARAVAFIQKEMGKESGELWHRWRDGHTLVTGTLEDYAFMIHGLLELYESTFEIQYLQSALAYNEILTDSFLDEANGGYFMTADDAEELIVRPKELYDGAIPSGNAIQMLNLLKLARLTGDSEFEKKSEETGKAFSGAIQQAPANFTQALIALQFAVSKTVEIVVVGDKADEKTQEMLSYIHSVYQPGKVVLLKEPADQEVWEKAAPFTKDLKMIGGKTTVYICRNFACEIPATSLEELKRRLK